MQKYEKRVSFNQGLAVGSFAGSAAFGATLPLDFVKQYIQSGYGYREIGGIVRREGINKLWRGLGVGGAVIAPQMAIKFGVYNGLHRVEWGGVGKGGVGFDVGCGFVAGLVDGAFLGAPLAVQAVQQMNTGVGVRGASRIVGKAGWGKFVAPLALRNGFYTMFMLGGIYPTRRALFGEEGEAGDGNSGNESESGLGRYMFQIFVASSLLNIGGCIASSPWDVIRAHQIGELVKGDGKGRIGFRQVSTDIWKSSGIRGFYRGFGNYVVTFGMRFPLTVVISELVKNMWIGCSHLDEDS